MKIRYKHNSAGFTAVAKIYSFDELNINPSDIDSQAVQVVDTLTKHGFETYIVGGAVRDLILGRKPKDFDVATFASPRQVTKFLNYSRVIGKRFRLVHVYFGDKIIEVSTFRSNKDTLNGNNNKYGSIEEDAQRRDFSVNSLYLNPLDKTVLDFNDAIRDFKRKKIVSLIPLSYTFKEDPVRMIRAIKYKNTTGFSLSYSLMHCIRKHSGLIQTVSKSRLTEELTKILSTGNCKDIITDLSKYGLLSYLLPFYSVHLNSNEVIESLDKLDTAVKEGKNLDLSEKYLALFYPLLTVENSDFTPSEMFSDLVRQAKILISPNTPPNIVIENSIRIFMKENFLPLPVLKKKTVPKKKQYIKKKKVNKKNRKPHDSNPHESKSYDQA